MNGDIYADIMVFFMLGSLLLIFVVGARSVHTVFFTNKIRTETGGNEVASNDRQPDKVQPVVPLSGQKETKNMSGNSRDNTNLVVAKEYAEKHGESEENIVQMIRDGALAGQIRDKVWYVDIVMTTPVEERPKTNGLAIASMVLGIGGPIIGLFIFFIPSVLAVSVLAVIFGHISRSQIKRSKGTISGNGMAFAGLVTGYIGLGALIGLVAPILTSHPDQEKVVVVKQEIQQIYSALTLYRLDNRVYPDMKQGLQALIQKPESGEIPQNWKAGGYLVRLPKDPWGAHYQYRIPGIYDEVEVFSLGADRQLGGEGFNADIGSWQD